MHEKVCGIIIPTYLIISQNVLLLGEKSHNKITFERSGKAEKDQFFEEERHTGVFVEYGEVQIDEFEVFEAKEQNRIAKHSTE